MQSTAPDSHSAKRRRTLPRSTAPAVNDQDLDESRFYDPTQDQHERQEIKKKSRALEREFNGAIPCTHTSNGSQSNLLQRTGMST